MENNRPFENNRGKNPEYIKGWGIDADPKNDPTYPIKKRTNEEHKGYTWDRPTQQPINIEVFHSIERPNVTAVFGTSVPPSGLSGMIRRMAFKKSENDYGHWLPLLIADRVNVVEGIIEDFMHGKVPNILAEKGYKADWQHNKTGLLTRVAVVAGITAAIVMLVRNNRD
ncbi:hypothetical protein [Pontibacter sp. H249]|uniref:hypothetical protein n=1 Tax=Pontibacter sp. H249 TaxID=3133420 RepID=UPI0030BCBFE3